MTPVRRRLRVEGVVQGVGFRPFVHGLAHRLALAGHVRNDTYGVVIEAEGDEDALATFEAALSAEAPALALVERVTSVVLPPTGASGFAIATSNGGGEVGTLVAADAATCADCLAELFDPSDRRHGYPFVNCTNCGPRFTIVTGIPYDRPNTTMAGFTMCEACAAEYHDPADRRFHAQPVCCPDCGPCLRLVDESGSSFVGGGMIDRAAGLLLGGAVVAVKGLGGYHLAADAGSETAVAALRARKHREEKPFAVMVADVDGARRLCHVSDEEAALLASPQRPIVLLARLGDRDEVAPSVAPGNRSLGVMLPYTPLHHLLLRAADRPIVLTSGNVSDEPIAFDDAEARVRLAGIADAFLTHDRPIHVRTDDSVARVVRGREVLLRRSRGWAPEPLTVPWSFPRPVLACGAELKSTFCVTKGGRAFVSHHIGDLENYETLHSFTSGIEHFCRLFEVTPEVVAHDLHPEYLSTKYALDLDGVELVGVQHHHAHVASCLADNGFAGPVVGLAFDGLGWGSDSTVWGGEVLIADLAGFERAAHLDPVPMPGGTAAIREPWRMAASHLNAAYGTELPAGLDVVARNRDRWDAVVTVAASGVASPMTSSAGRLFDAVAALVAGRDGVSYEGQAAIELEQLADPSVTDGYPVTALAGAELVRCVVDDLLAGVAPSVVAARFHNAFAFAAAETACRVAEESGLSTVALSGGVFQNLLFAERVTGDLESRGLTVLVHHRVPCNDGGISLGQAVVAAMRDR